MLPPDAPQTPSNAPPNGSVRLQREAETLVAKESQLLVELRKLELDRRIEVEKLPRSTGSSRTRRAG